MTTKNSPVYMGIDQYGKSFQYLIHPRKDLMDRLGYRSASKMYTEDREGNTHHVGYVIGPHWVSVYKVEPFKG